MNIWHCDRQKISFRINKNRFAIDKSRFKIGKNRFWDRQKLVLRSRKTSCGIVRSAESRFEISKTGFAIGINRFSKTHFGLEKNRFRDNLAKLVLG